MKKQNVFITLMSLLLKRLDLYQVTPLTVHFFCNHLADKIHGGLDYSSHQYETTIFFVMFHLSRLPLFEKSTSNGQNKRLYLDIKFHSLLTYGK